MCFTVRSNIHPTSAPTGTEEDIVGSSKLTPSVETGDDDGNRVQAVSAIFFLKPDKSSGIAHL